MARSMPSNSDGDTLPIRFLSRCLSAVMIWSAIALPWAPLTSMRDSNTYSLLVLLVTGITCTRLMAPLDASLLTMTAGRVFLTSEPIAGSKSTHQSSPRFIDAPGSGPPSRHAPRARALHPVPPRDTGPQDPSARHAD